SLSAPFSCPNLASAGTSFETILTLGGVLSLCRAAGGGVSKILCPGQRARNPCATGGSGALPPLSRPLCRSSGKKPGETRIRLDSSRGGAPTGVAPQYPEWSGG